MALAVRLEHHAEEAPIGYVARLAAANGFPSLRKFLAHTETTASAIAQGEPAAVSLVADWSGVSTQDLIALASEAGDDRHTWRLGNAIFNKDMRPGHLIRFCPDCILNDRLRGSGRIVSRAYHRAWWAVRGIEGCHVHDRKLSELAVASDDDRHDFPRFVDRTMDFIRAEATASAPRTQPMLDEYLVRRVSEQRGTSYLDELEAHVAWELSHYLGEFISLHAIEDRMRAGCNSDEWGFRLANGGQLWIRKMISSVIDRKRPKTQSGGGVLGPMVRWLRRNSSKNAYQPVVDLVQDILASSMPFGPGQTILKPVTYRRIHCINSAHEEFGLPKDRIRALVADLPGFRSGFTDAQTYFDAVAATPILKAAQETLTSKEAGDALGLTEQRMWDLIDAGSIELVEKRADNMRAYVRIGRTAINDLERRLSDIMTTAATDEGLIPLAAAARSWRRPFHKVIAMIFEGTLEAHLLSGDEPVFGRIRVRPDGLKLDVSPVAGGDEKWMRTKEVEKVLGTTTATVSELIERSYLRVQSVRRETGRTVRVVERRSVSEFETTYVSLSAIAKSTTGYRAEIKAELEKLGVAPIFEPEGFIARFYRRSALAQVGFRV
ncbi:TniQ protein [Rhizobium sp. PP-F2F-G36]|nr:TniQ protein [Rhizobium sp. PP-F2F-G36]